MSKSKEVMVSIEPSAILPAKSNLQADETVVNFLQVVKENLRSVENYKLPRIKTTPSGFEVEPGKPSVAELKGVILLSKKTNVYYNRPYNKNDLSPPTCFSLDGDKPDPSVKIPVSVVCRGCPMAEFGTNAMKSGKACRNLKPLYVLLERDGELDYVPRQLIVTPSSLASANNYLVDVTARRVTYRDVATRISTYRANPDDTYSKLRFDLVKKLSPQECANVKALKDVWISVMDSQVVDQKDMDAADNATTVTGDY